MKTRRQLWSEEFSMENLRLTQKNNLEFYYSQWQIGTSTNLLFVIYKIILALTFSVTLVISVIDLNDINKSAVMRAKWMIYLTNWHFSVGTLQSVLAAYMVTSMYINVRKYGEHKQQSFVNRTLCSMYWCLNTIAINGALFVSVVYWTMVYDEKIDPLSMVNIFTHAVSAFLLVLDCFIVAHSIRVLHFYLPIVFNMTYVSFTIIYYRLGGTSKHGLSYIYGIINWNRPSATFKNIFLVCFFAFILHILVWFFARLRKRLAKLLFRNENTNNVLYTLSQLQEPLKGETPEKEDTNHNLQNQV